jgi:hypothetical protein
MCELRHAVGPAGSITIHERAGDGTILDADELASERSEPRERPASAPEALRRGLAEAFSEGGSEPAKRRARERVGGPAAVAPEALWRASPEL